MLRAEQLAAVALRGRTQSNSRAAGGKVGRVHPVELPDCRSRSESEAAERANAARFTAAWWSGRFTGRLSHRTPAGRSQMLSTLFYSPLRKLILLIECCP